MYNLSQRNSVFIRLLKPGYHYPSNCFKHRDALYYPSENVVFIVTKSQPSEYEAITYTEIAIWAPGEIRLLGALMLSVPEEGGVVIFSPWCLSVVPHIPFNADLSSDSIIASCLEFAVRLRTELEESNRTKYVLYKANRSAPDVEKSLFENIDPTDGLLIRGLYTLMKSQLLIHTDPYLFMEEAFINLQISIEAALQIIREHLSYLGNPNPSYRDAHDYIRSNFRLGDPLVEYLHMQYESWIETKHPLNIYGAEWAPSLSADDVFETYGPLISIYSHIVLDEPGRSSMLP